MACRDLLDESTLGDHDVPDRLTRHGFGEEDHKIDRVSGPERDADL